MQILRCTRDTTVLPPDGHHQDHEQHATNEGSPPPLHTTASSTTRSSCTSLPQALASHLTPSHRTASTWGNGLCAT